MFIRLIDFVSAITNLAFDLDSSSIEAEARTLKSNISNVIEATNQKADSS